MNQDIDVVAAELRHHYTARRRHKFPQFTLDMHRYPSTMWERIAATVVELRADVAAYVDLFFEFCASQSASPGLAPPNLLAHQDFVFFWRSRSVDYEESTRLWGLMVSLWNAQVAALRTPEQILDDTTLYLCPTFRYGMARRCGLTQAANFFRNDGLKFLRSHPAYIPMAKPFLALGDLDVIPPAP